MTKEERENNKTVSAIIAKAREIVKTNPDAGRVRIVRKVGICCGNCEYHYMTDHKIRCNNPESKYFTTPTQATVHKTCEDWVERRYFL